MTTARPRAMWSAALLTLLLTGWTAWRDGAVSATAPPAAMLPPAIQATVSASPQSSERDPLLDSGADPFAAVSFTPAPTREAVAPAAPPPMPKPIAPSFPYQYFGKMVGVDGKLMTYLSLGDTLVAIRERDVLQSAYRIDAISDTQISVTYLPLEEKMTLATRSAAN